MPPPSAPAVFPEIVLLARDRNPPEAMRMAPPLIVAELPEKTTPLSVTVPLVCRPPPSVPAAFPEIVLLVRDRKLAEAIWVAPPLTVAVLPENTIPLSVTVPLACRPPPLAVPLAALPPRTVMPLMLSVGASESNTRKLVAVDERWMVRLLAPGPVMVRSPPAAVIVGNNVKS